MSSASRSASYRRPRWFSTKRGQTLVAVNAAIFLVLAGLALWLFLHGGKGSPGAGTGSGPSRAGGPGGHIVAPGVERVPVFTVAPPYGAAPLLSPTQALFAGRVVDGTTQAPLPGAELRIDQAGGRATVHTDARGRFQMVIETARPFGYTVDAPKHGGGVGFGKLCPGDRPNVTIALPPAGSPPSAPMAIQGPCR